MKKPSFRTGHMAGRAFVYALRGGGPPGFLSGASVGYNKEGEVEIVAHRDAQEAADYCDSRGYASAVVWDSWCRDEAPERTFDLHVLERHREQLAAAGCMECVARLEPVIAAKVTDIDARDEYFEDFLDGFAEGTSADDSTVPVVVGAPLRFKPREDARRLGLAVGGALAAELARIADGGELVPCQDEVGILFLPGAEEATITRSATPLGERWSRCDTRQGAMIQRGAGGVLVISSPRYRGSSVLFLLALEVAVRRGKLQTSTVGPVVGVYDNRPDYEPFMTGLHEGMARHARGPEILAGFGVLGEYRQRDNLWENETRADRLLQPLRRAWSAASAVSWFGWLPFGRGREQKVKKLRIQRDPSKMYAVFRGDVYATPKRGNDNVIVIPPDREDYELVCSTGITPEPGYVYFLDPDGDLSRRPLW